MKISVEEVEHVAELSRIKLTEEEKNKFTTQLSAIIDYVEELNEAPTEDIKSIDQIAGLKNITRSDEIEKSLEINQVLQNAPAKQERFLKVKQVF